MMAAHLSELLLEASEEVVDYARPLAETPNTEQQFVVKKIISAAELFSNRITEMAELIDSGEPIGNVSHELRTPIVTMRGFCDLMLMGIFGALSDLQVENWKRLQASANSLSGFVDDLLNNRSP